LRIINWPAAGLVARLRLYERRFKKRTASAGAPAFDVFRPRSRPPATACSRCKNNVVVHAAPSAPGNERSPGKRPPWQIAEQDVGIICLRGAISNAVNFSLDPRPEEAAPALNPSSSLAERLGLRSARPTDRAEERKVQLSYEGTVARMNTKRDLGRLAPACCAMLQDVNRPCSPPIVAKEAAGIVIEDVRRASRGRLRKADPR